MWNLFILNETFSNGLDYGILNVISAISIFCGIFVIVSKNPVVSILFLIGLFLSIAGYLMILGINFIGLSYLLVYVGAVSILFLFILMLINVRVSELITDNNNSVPLAMMIGVFFNIVLYKSLPHNFIESLDINNIQDIYFSSNKNENMTYGIIKDIPNYNNNLSFVSSQIWDGNLIESSHITSIGNVMYTVYPIWLILTSIILLLAMVGAIVITIKK